MCVLHSFPFFAMEFFLQIKQLGGLMNDVVQAHLWMKKGTCTDENKRADGETLLKSILGHKKQNAYLNILHKKKSMWIT